MPELPEVEAVRKQIECSLIGQRFERVAVADDHIVFDRATPDQVRSALMDRTVLSAERKGKYFWLVLDEPPYPVFHFGMAGRFLPYDPTHEPPKYWKLAGTVSNGASFAFTDMRRLGRIRLALDPRSEPPISLLGFDALTELPSTKKMAALLARRAAPIKAVLLDQGFAAGVGNWVADEVLYQGRISPLRSAMELTQKEVGALRSALRAVLQQAVAVDARSSQFPSNWLFHRRWDRKIEFSARGEALARRRVGGRTTVWAPSRQH